MWTVLVLLILWILSMYFYLPLPIVVLLFAALASGTSVTIWAAWINRKQRLASVGERDSNP
jgi:Flp pilus assembly protein TadB